jgi:DDE family transposase
MEPCGSKTPGRGESRHQNCLTRRAPYKLFALAYNLANSLRTLALPDTVAQWTLTTLREKLVKIGARIVRHGRYVVFQLAEVAVPRALFAQILRRIDRLRPRPPPLPA